MSHLAPGLLVLTLVSVFSLMIPACQGAVCNQSGWFGTNCQYKCHCTNDIYCDSTSGECPAGCAKGWFGPQCQYADLTTTHSTTSTPSWLYDGNDNTCNTDTTTQTVTIQLEDPLPVTWLRLYVNSPENVEAFTVTFRTKTGDNTVACNNMKTGTANDKTLDILCDLSVEVQEVILTGDGVKSLCSVYISGGRNVALKQSVWQSSTWQSYEAYKAVDGNTDGNLGHGSCAHTQVNTDFDPQWSVTFLLPQMINRYVLYNRQDDFPARLQYFILSSFDGTGSQVIHYQDQLQQPQPIYTVTSMTSTSPIKKITIKATQANINNVFTPVLTLCEVEAYGDAICENGKYGRECEQNCGPCLNNICFVSTGWCINGCQDGFFGYRCDEQCSPNCINNVCDPSTKRCTEGCKDGFYGLLCGQACSGNCNGGVCAQSDGTCFLGCKTGYTGLQCGTSCNTKCKDDVCKQDTGNCQHGCDVGFYGPKCENACSVNCVDNRCEQSSGTCSNGCKEGFNGITCENACPHPTYGKNCAQTCSTNCKDQKCNHINGKCDLCIPGKRGDQCDQECNHPTYGQNCSKTCSTKCVNQDCNKINGTCDRCPDGWTGDHCDQACPRPTYGPDCTQTCSINCTGQRCNNENGKCDLCIPGTLGDMCEQECRHPTYGQDCSQTCSMNCVNQECNKINGTCDRCPAGWTGDQCDQVCPNTAYGERCKQICSVYCMNEICNPVNGTCDHCVAGKLGFKCDQDCPEKTFGLDCKATCNANCVGQICHTVTGKCISCPPGKRGDQCEEECSPGKYGPGCTQTCNKNCYINATHNVACNIDSGICLQGCFSGYTGLQCESKISEDSSADLAVGAGIGVGVTVLVCIIGISVYCYWRRSSKVAKARRQRPPGYEETVMNNQDEHPYREMFKSSDGYNLPTDATSTELSTPRSRSRITVTENTTTPYMNADVGHYEDITDIGNMDGAAGNTISIEDVTTTLEKGRNNEGYTYANC